MLFQQKNYSCSKGLDCEEQNYSLALMKMKCSMDIRKCHQERVSKLVLTKRERLVECKKPSSVKQSWLQTKMQNHNSVSKQYLEGFGHALITTCKTLKVTKNAFMPSGQLCGKDKLFLSEASDKRQNFCP